MRIVSNERLIRRNTQIGKYAFNAGMLILVIALVLNLFAISRAGNAQDVTLLSFVIAAFFVGYTLNNIGTVFRNRWGRRSDKALAEALKGLDERYSLYNYLLGASHVLVGPNGVVVLHPKYQAGPIAYNGRRWVNPGARRGLFGLTNPDPLGNPVLEAAGELESFNRFVAKHAPGLQVAPQAIIVFMHPRAEVQAPDSPVPVMHFKQLKDHIRRLPKNPAFAPQALADLAQAQTQPGERAKPRAN